MPSRTLVDGMGHSLEERREWETRKRALNKIPVTTGTTQLGVGRWLKS